MPRTYFFVILQQKSMNTTTTITAFNMGKTKINLEYELRSNTANIIWNIISTDAGLAKWIADEVQADGETITFTWGNPDGHHEKRSAHILQKTKNDLIRLQWNDEQDPEAFLEIKMSKSDLTNAYHLCIIDFAWEEDVDSLRDIWEQNFEELHRNTGL